MKRIDTVKDSQAKTLLETFVKDWVKGIPGKTIEETLNEI
jgi:hypothetical protein